MSIMNGCVGEWAMIGLVRMSRQLLGDVRLPAAIPTWQAAEHECVSIVDMS